MAEAGVETAATSARFFCHKCYVEITPLLPDLLCPRCNCGFIEELEGGRDSDSDTSSDMDAESDDVWGLLSQDASAAASSSSTSNSGPRTRQRHRHTINPRTMRRRVSGDRQTVLAPLLHDLIMQMTSGVLEASVGGADLGGGGLPTSFEFPGVPVVVASNLASNPGDYAWGRGGLDAIITQLMNQLDGTGPPPLPQDKIAQIPTVKITQEQVDKSVQCSVCMEDFKLDEPVRKLRCEHCYHRNCIIPWLELHGTCPVCRTTLQDNDSSCSGATGNSGAR
ncbi:E3 ubiquitin-protein ligase RNF115-like isoform X4 [Oratosquilla oratoria]